MKWFSSSADGWCSLHASLSSYTNFPSLMSFFACSKARVFSFTPMKDLSFLWSNCVREGLGHFTFVPPCCALEWLHCPRLVDVDDRVELVGETGPEVVA